MLKLQSMAILPFLRVYSQYETCSCNLPETGLYHQEAVQYLQRPRGPDLLSQRAGSMGIGCIPLYR